MIYFVFSRLFLGVIFFHQSMMFYLSTYNQHKYNWRKCPTGFLKACEITFFLTHSTFNPDCFEETGLFSSDAAPWIIVTASLSALVMSVGMYLNCWDRGEEHDVLHITLCWSLLLCHMLSSCTSACNSSSARNQTESENKRCLLIVVVLWNTIILCDELGKGNRNFVNVLFLIFGVIVMGVSWMA